MFLCGFISLNSSITKVVSNQFIQYTSKKNVSIEMNFVNYSGNKIKVEDKTLLTSDLQIKGNLGCC